MRRGALLRLPPLPSPLRFWSAHRRAVTAGLLALAGVLGLAAVVGVHVPQTAVVVAARDLPAGHVLADDDLAVVDLPSHIAPATALGEIGAAVGRMTSVPLSRFEVLTPARVLTGSAAGLAVPLRLADREVTRLLRAGDRVDVLAAETSDGQVRPARLLARDLRIVTVLDTDTRTLASGGLIVVACDEDTAALLAGTVSGVPLTVVLRGS